MADEQKKKKKETEFLERAKGGDYNFCSYPLKNPEENTFEIDYVNLTDSDGNTALMLAIKYAINNDTVNANNENNEHVLFKKYIELLIKKGSDLNAVNNDGQTALEMATSNKLLFDMLNDALKHKPILDSLERGEFEVKEDGIFSSEESKQKLRDLEESLKKNDKSIDEIEGHYLKKIKSFVKTYILLKGGKRIKNKRSNKNKRSQKTKSLNFRKTRHRSRV